MVVKYLKFLKYHFWQSRKFLADNRRELGNEVYKELYEQFNKEFVTTAAES